MAGDGIDIDWPEASEAEERERLAELSDAELREEMERIETDIEKWRSEYDVDSPSGLRASIDEEMELDERERRREIAYDWEYSLYVRRMIRDVLGGRDS